MYIEKRIHMYIEKRIHMYMFRGREAGLPIYSRHPTGRPQRAPRDPG
jgi:hypothetical protein